MGSPAKVKPPKPSATEVALQQQQLDMLKQQQALLQQSTHTQDLLAPFLYQSIGLTPKYDASGNITGFTQAVDPNKDLQKKIEGEFLQRTQDALEGKLPVDKNLTDELTKQERTLRETLQKQLGTDYETSTPGIEALANFNKTKAALLDSASRGDLTLGEQLGLAQHASNQNDTSDMLRNALGIANNPFATGVQGFGNAAAGINPALNYYQGNRNMQLQANLFNASQPSTLSQILGGAGSLIGTGVGLGLSPYSGFSNTLFGHMFT